MPPFADFGQNPRPPSHGYRTLTKPKLDAKIIRKKHATPRARRETKG